MTIVIYLIISFVISCINAYATKDPLLSMFVFIIWPILLPVMVLMLLFEFIGSLNK